MMNIPPPPSKTFTQRLSEKIEMEKILLETERLTYENCLANRLYETDAHRKYVYTTLQHQKKIVKILEAELKRLEK